MINQGVSFLWGRIKSRYSDIPEVRDLQKEFVETFKVQNIKHWSFMLNDEVMYETYMEPQEILDDLGITEDDKNPEFPGIMIFDEPSPSNLNNNYYNIYILNKNGEYVFYAPEWGPGNRAHIFPINQVADLFKEIEQVLDYNHEMMK